MGRNGSTDTTISHEGIGRKMKNDADIVFIGVAT